ncbi:hypothetical protein CVD25_22450 [Bacillus canaveralius]|uniref:Uncharacterized protein n=1 Tax=Bacillus canaveralius TaxID=1403243 RepID=A0A2N5GFQ1_9BACI|nr:hypothetical protein [Bacillus canaveralius]PLR79589.1 hypothetical protein CU635_22355 [Bacillus canaveralius]PLR88574.1 hypothetical protein CVD25_22450 [Bacillus canaveralius]RSK45278.1 hypothetical protein EJA13_19800 [Bacillus canaveralius]
MSLAEMFIKNKGEAININGSLVVMSHRLEVNTGQDVKIEFIRTKNDFRQGIEFSLDKRKGYIEVNNQKLNSPVFWVDTAPSTFIFKCFPKKETGQLNLWNIWQYNDDRVDAWIGNAGIIAEQEDEGIFIFRCSNGIGDIDFDDLVFRLILL